jgi:hypothetical protein
VRLRFSYSRGSLPWLECPVALISFLWPKLFPSPIDLHSPIWFPRPAGPSSFRLLHDFSICSVSLHCSVRSSFGSAWSLSDRHLAQPGLCLIVIWLSLVSVRSSFGSAWSLSDRHLAQPGLCPIVSGLYPIVTWLSQVSVQSVGSLSDRHFAQPGLRPIMPGLCPIVFLLSLFLRVVCRWPDSFCDLLFRLSFVIDLSRDLSSTIPGFRCGS